MRHALAAVAVVSLTGVLLPLAAHAATDPDTPSTPATIETSAAADTTAPVIAPVEVPDAATLGAELLLPATTATDDSGETPEVIVTVTGPDGVDARVHANAEGSFPLTPGAAGAYTVTYAAIDAADNLAQATYDFSVASPASADTPATRVVELPSETPGRVSFGAIGDIHNNWSELDQAFGFWKQQNVDATLFVGDLTNNATAAEYQGMRDTLDRSQGDLPVIASLGNHDVGPNLSGYKLFESALGQAPNADYVMNGYHFITVSPGSGPLNESTMYPSASNGGDYSYAAGWLKTRLAAAVAENPELPIFVLVHSPLRCTHYVSNEWYGSGLATGCGDNFDSLFEAYPQAVVWGGHIHTPNHIPTSIWQGAEGAGGFTTVNAPPLAYYEFESGVANTDPRSKNTNDSTPDDGGDNRETAIVQVEGSVVTIKNYDLRAQAWTDQVWTWDVADSVNASLPFTERFPLGDARADRTAAPVWPTGSAVTVSEIQPTEAMVTFPQAAPAPNEVGDIVHKYRYRVIDVATQQEVNTFTQWSGFYFIPMPETRNHIVWNLAPGREYEVRITPINAWGAEGEPLSSTFKTHGFDVVTRSVGAGTATASVTDAMPGETVTLTATPARGEQLLGWDVISGDITIVDGSFTMPDTKVEIEAVFSGPDGSTDPHAVTTAVRGDGTVTASAESATSGQKVSLSGKSGKGTKLWGWEVAVEGLDFVENQLPVARNGSFTMPVRDVTVTGVFGKARDYGILYDGNGATSGSTAPTQLPVRGTGTLAENGFERTWFAFNGWNTGADGSGTRYAPGATVEALANARETITLYAQWKPVTSGLVSESFDGLKDTLKIGVQHTPGVLGWTSQGPNGWSVTNAPNMPKGGVEELRGWAFVTHQFWESDDQERSSFTRAKGVFAVADGDEWNDAPGAGVIDTTLNAPALALPTGSAQVRVQWDNSYRQEDPQTAEAYIEFDTGERVTLASWGPGSPEHDDMNSHRDELVDVPEGATSAVVKFHYVAGNNWWWAVDNVSIDAIVPSLGEPDPYTGS